jgi:hypothetical protein
MFSLNAMKKLAAGLPHRDVTEAEFVRLVLADRSVRDKAEAVMQARVNRGLGAHTQVGKEMLHVVDRVKRVGRRRKNQ